MYISSAVSVLRLSAIVFLFTLSINAQGKIPEPKDVIGFTPGEDRKLANWDQVVEYFKRLDQASERVQFQEIGKSTIGAPFVYATISSPENLKNLEKYKQINAKLADPRTFKSNDRIARQLVAEGKTIVLITCGVHSTEVGSYLSSMLIADKLARATDDETLKILNDTIILLVPSLNPDGVDIVKNWYDKTLGTPYEGTDPPELYHKYVGHDDNRDWYAFTQVETQLTVDKIHNVWHPQIVHDIHQQRANGARMFLPPYMPPVEPNVPKKLVEGYTELGSYMAKTMRDQGFQGITTDSTYDAWTPGRAYSHYHGGVRMLSETASCRLATPIMVKFESLREGLGYDPKRETPNFSPLWKGGEWHIGDITNYMTTGALSLLKHAADNRERWLENFYAIGKEAVRPRKNGELFAYLIPRNGSVMLTSILRRGGVTFENNPKPFKIGKTKYDSAPLIVPMAQPYGNFAKALLEKQDYPDLKDAKGNPIPPYDVTAHTLPLFANIEVQPIYQRFKYSAPKNQGVGDPGGVGASCDCGFGIKGLPFFRIYRSSIPAIDEGWTRWVMENYVTLSSACCYKFVTVTDKEIRQGLNDGKSGASNYYNAGIIFPDQTPSQMLNGYAKGSMPDEFTGGIGNDGVKILRKFVEDGGTLIFLNRASRFAIEQFGLPLRDVTEGLARKDFFIPGSILRTEINRSDPIANGMPERSIAWFEDSPAFEITTSDETSVRIIASYPKNPSEILLSGWALGKEKLAGKAALVSIAIGKGKIVLFGFRPQ